LIACSQLDPVSHKHGEATAHAGHTSADLRQAVKFPAEMREHTLTNMRDHLLALQQIQDALARQKYTEAADIAEQRLGMSSLRLHGAHDASKFMPQGMQNVGTSMHRSASQFGAVAQEASVTGDLAKTLASLSVVTSSCVACHAAYRLE
jgi:hypothetical protein